MQQCQKARALAAQVRRNKVRLDKVLKQSTVFLDEELSNDVAAIVGEGDIEVQKLPEKSFKRMFWEQQVCGIACYKYIHGY